MCTGICWVIRCGGCGTVVMKDSHVSGHTCRRARRNRKRGCCRTGIEYTSFDKFAEELCVLCELMGEIRCLDAETCDEAYSEERVGYDAGDCDSDDDDEEGGASLAST